MCLYACMNKSELSSCYPISISIPLLYSLSLSGCVYILIFIILFVRFVFRCHVVKIILCFLLNNSTAPLKCAFYRRYRDYVNKFNRVDSVCLCVCECDCSFVCLFVFTENLLSPLFFAFFSLFVLALALSLVLFCFDLSFYFMIRFSYFATTQKPG